MAHTIDIFTTAMKEEFFVFSNFTPIELSLWHVFNNKVALMIHLEMEFDTRIRNFFPIFKPD